MESSASSARTGGSDSDLSNTQLSATVAVSTLTEAHLDSSTRKPCPLPPEVQRPSPRYDASTAPQALEFALAGQR